MVALFELFPVRLQPGTPNEFGFPRSPDFYSSIPCQHAHLEPIKEIGGRMGLSKPISAPPRSEMLKFYIGYIWAYGLGLLSLHPLGRDVSSPIKDFSDIRHLGGVKVGSWAWAAHPGNAIVGHEVFLMKTRSKVATFPQK